MLGWYGRLDSVDGRVATVLKLLLVFCLGTLGKRGTGETTEKSATEREREKRSVFNRASDGWAASATGEKETVPGRAVVESLYFE